MKWDPLDESDESYILGDILLGEHQHKLREEATPVEQKTGVVTGVDGGIVSISFVKRESP